MTFCLLQYNKSTFLELAFRIDNTFSGTWTDVSFGSELNPFGVDVMSSGCDDGNSGEQQRNSRVSVNITLIREEHRRALVAVHQRNKQDYLDQYHHTWTSTFSIFFLEPNTN